MPAFWMAFAADEQDRSRKQPYHLNVTRLDQLLRDKGMTLEVLARKTGLDLRTIQRKCQGRPAKPSTVHAIAAALGTTFRDLVHDPGDRPSTVSQERPARFRIRLRLSGSFQSNQQKDYLLRLNEKIASALDREGITLRGQAFTVATSHFAGSGAFRLLIAIPAVTDGRPSWLLAAVKPTMLGALCKAEEIDTGDFRFGEVIETGWGRAIPKSAMMRAADLFQCDPLRILVAAML